MGRQYAKPMAAAVGVFSIWGFSFLASKVAQESATPAIVLMYRFDIAIILMLIPWIIGKQKIQLKGKNIKGLLLLGLCEPVLYFIGEQYGIRYTNSAFSGVMIAVIPIVTLILSSIVLKEKATKLQWLFSIISIVGVVAITLISGGEGTITGIGVVFLILAVLTGSGYSVISKAISDDFTVYERSVVMQIMGAVFFTGFAIVENIHGLDALIMPLSEKSFLLGILYLSLGASVAGYTFYNYAVANAPIANVTSLCNLTTVLSVLAGVVILKEKFSVFSAIALVVILVGIWGVQKFGPKEI